MNEELTNEVLEAMTKCDRKCDRCAASSICDVGVFLAISKLATALLEERAKPRVWDGAPNDAVECHIVYRRRDDSGEDLKTFKTYTRELPKTRTREIAENIVHGIYGGANGKDIEYVEGVLKRYAEELEGKE